MFDDGDGGGGGGDDGMCMPWHTCESQRTTLCVELVFFFFFTFTWVTVIKFTLFSFLGVSYLSSFIACLPVLGLVYKKLSFKLTTFNFLLQYTMWNADFYFWTRCHYVYVFQDSLVILLPLPLPLPRERWH